MNSTNGSGNVQVKSAWNTKFGLLLERYSAPQMRSFDNNLATLFSLLHPLDEMAPLLLMKSGMCKIQGVA